MACTGVMKYYIISFPSFHIVDRRKTYCSPGDKRLDNPSILPRLLNLRNGKRPLDDIHRRQAIGIISRKALAHQLQHTPSSNTRQNQLILQRSRNQLQLLCVLILPDNKEVTRTSLRHHAILAKQPQHLVETLRSSR